MKSFYRVIGITSGIFFIMIIVSIGIASSYISTHRLSLNQLFNFNDTQFSNVSTENGFSFNTIFSPKKYADRFEKITINKEDTFPLVDSISVNVSIEDIQFIEEKRNDIKVVYNREKPDVKDYNLNYTASVDKNRLNIDSILEVHNLILNYNYKGSIKIYVPEGYHFKEVSLSSSMNEIKTGNIYDNCDQLTIDADLGNIDLLITYPKELLDIDCALGELTLETETTITSLICNTDLGASNIRLNGKVGSFTSNNNMGKITIESQKSIDQIILSDSMGAIEATFKGYVGSAQITANMGSITAKFYENSDMNIYAKADMGEVTSDFPITKSKDKANFVFTSNMGAITIKSK